MILDKFVFIYSNEPVEYDAEGSLIPNWVKVDEFWANIQNALRYSGEIQNSPYGLNNVNDAKIMFCEIKPSVQEGRRVVNTVTMKTYDIKNINDSYPDHLEVLLRPVVGV